MTLPLLLSVPHAGRRLPPEVEDLCALSAKNISEDGDEGAATIYLPLGKKVAAIVTTDIARAFVDMNRAENDFRKDGVIKTHTCWDVPVYRKTPSRQLSRLLIEKYHRPYHEKLTQLAQKVKLGIDCHTMAAQGPPIGPDPGQERPPVCLSNADGTCPESWIESFAACLEKTLQTEVSLNRPFKGGYIIVSHAKEMPWLQMEFSRSDFLSNKEKQKRLLAALQDWCAERLA